METPDSEPTINLFGMKIVPSDIMPEGYVALQNPNGQVGMIDLNTGKAAVFDPPFFDIDKGFREFCSTQRYEGAKVDPFGPATPGIEPMYSVSQHMINVESLMIDGDLLTPHNFDLRMELAEQQLRREIARKKDKIVSSLLTGQTESSPWGESKKPFTLDDLDDMIREADERKRKMDKSLIEALLAAGVDVKVTDCTNRPVVHLPEDYRQAYDEVKREARNRDPVENIYRDMGSNFFTPPCGQLLS